jgi:hypothetical protein
MSLINNIYDFIGENTEITESLYSAEFHTNIDQALLENHLIIIKENLSKHEIPKTIIKKCYGVIVEALENAKKHASKKEEYTAIFHKFEIGPSTIELCFGNYVSNADTPNLLKYLEIINAENIESLKSLMYEKAADGNPLSKKGGAGVGLFDMAIRAEGKIKYKLFKINSKHYYLTFFKINY